VDKSGHPRCVGYSVVLGSVIDTFTCGFTVLHGQIVVLSKLSYSLVLVAVASTGHFCAVDNRTRRSHGESCFSPEDVCEFLSRDVRADSFCGGYGSGGGSGVGNLGLGGGSGVGSGSLVFLR